MRRYVFAWLLLLLTLWPEDGQYTIEVQLTGGTGRASIDSPAPLTVSGKTMTATLVWSSPYYEYMRVDGVQYDPIQTEGNSTFEIPIVLDTDMPLTAQTIAMSQPHEIEYTLYFDSSTIQPRGGGTSALLIVMAIIMAGIGIVLVCIFFVAKVVKVEKHKSKQKK